jgi:hypothetical protein
MVAACASNSAGPAFDRRWTGRVTASSGATCSPSDWATLTQRGNEFIFVPNDGAIMITGMILKDNSIHGTLPLVGADHKPFTLTLDGTLTNNGFEGTFITPRCQSKVSLHPA